MKLCPIARPSTLADMVRVYEYNSCGRWFSRDTMRFFGTRLCPATFTALAPGVYGFVSSDFSGFDRTARAYSVRVFEFEKYAREDGRECIRCHVSTPGGVGAYHSRKAAAKALRDGLHLEHL